jgi:hypothetical protein
MPTYAELAQEAVWGAEFEASALADFNERLRAHYQHTRAQTGSKGDNRHLKGRHRSRNWDLTSQYCTNRAYATTKPRDKRGDGDWLRATDIGITGVTLRAAAARLDAAVRSGKLPMVAEWFGTVDGVNVVGWFEGSSSSSDSSHLYHLHVGYWTDSCNDATQFQLLGDIIIGDNMLTDAEIKRIVDEVWNRDVIAGPDTKPAWQALGETYRKVLALESGTIAGPVDLSAAAITEIRDAVADGLEGGSTAVRADA